MDGFMDKPAEEVPRYDLYTRDGDTRFFWRLTDHGVAVEPGALVLYRAGQWTRAPYDRIMSVGLSTGSAGRGNVIANCTITLTNGSRIIVSNVKASGVSDLSRDADYRHFVKDFHKALVASGAASAITFRSGFSEGRMTGLRISLVIAGLFFIALPLVLLLITRELKALWITLAGIAFIVPMVGIARTNQPGTYRPDMPPDLLP